MAAASACSSKAPDEPAVATPSLSLNHERVPIGSPLKLTYKFTVAPNASFDGDYTVFVHVLDPEGERLWTDDHVPPTPTSTWKPGQVIEYSRTVFVPNYPYIGEANVRLGLYRGDKRLPLEATEASRREYTVSKFQLLPQSENIFLIYKDGWHPAEVSEGTSAAEWQWTKKTASISFRNPKKDVVFYLESDARVDQFPTPQQVTLRIGDQTVGTFAADNKDQKLRMFTIPASVLGNGDLTEVVLDVDRTFTPGGTDPRELGIRVFNAYVDPR
jgi:hypothetical protein